VAFLLMASLTSPAAHAAGVSSLSGELNLVVGVSEDDGWISEIPGSQRNSAGFEYYRRLAGEYGDYLTIDLQARVSYDSREPGGDAVGLEIHNAWLEYRLGLGKNLRIGHFAPAHGLEPITDTHGTVLQTLAMEDVGFKKDWGVGYRGILGPFDLSVAAQLGAGMGIQRSDGSLLLSAQIWEPPGDDFRIGLSLLAGRVLRSRGGWTVPPPGFGSDAVEMSRAGAAAVFAVGPLELRGELTVGENDGSGVAGAMLEVGRTPSSLPELRVEAQGRVWTGDLDESDALVSSVALGASYSVTSEWTLRSYVIQGLSKPGDTEDTRLVFQAYYFGG
jgi:hypothetical protein